MTTQISDLCKLPNDARKLNSSTENLSSGFAAPQATDGSALTFYSGSKAVTSSHSDSSDAQPKEYFVLIPSKLSNRRDVDAETKLIFGYIAFRIRGGRNPYFTQAELAREFGLTRHLVGRRFRNLEKLGILKFLTQVVVGRNNKGIGLKEDRYLVNKPAFFKFVGTNKWLVPDDPPCVIVTQPLCHSDRTNKEEEISTSKDIDDQDVLSTREMSSAASTTAAAGGSGPLRASEPPVPIVPKQDIGTTTKLLGSKTFTSTAKPVPRPTQSTSPGLRIPPTGPAALRPPTDPELWQFHVDHPIRCPFGGRSGFSAKQFEKCYDWERKGIKDYVERHKVELRRAWLSAHSLVVRNPV